MADDVVLNIGVDADPGSVSLIDSINQRLAGMRQNLKDTAAASANFNEQAGRFQSAVTGKFQSQAAAEREAATVIVESAKQIGVQVDAVVTSFVEMSRAIDITNVEAVKAFRGQTTELTAYLEQLGATDVALDRIKNSLADLSTRQRAAAAPAVAAGPVATGGAAGIDPTALKITADASTQLEQNVNVLIARFQALGESIDTSSAEAVAAFQAEGAALTNNLIKLGATDEQLNQIGATIARAEKSYGTFTAGVNQNTSAINNGVAGSRRGANAIATLAFGLNSGSISARSMAGAIGQVTTTLSSASTGLAAFAPEIGAVVTLLIVIVGLFHEWNDTTEKQKNTMTDLGNLNAAQMRILDTAFRNQVQSAQRASVQAREFVNEAARESRDLNPLAAFSEAAGIVAVVKADKTYKTILEHYEEFTKQFVQSQTKQDAAVAEEIVRGQEKSAELITNRTKGEFAARRVAADNELADQKRALGLRGLTEEQANRQIENLDIQHREAIKAIDKSENDARRALFEKLQGDRLASIAQGDRDEFQSARQAAANKAKAESDAIAANKTLDPKDKAQAELLIQQRLTQDLINIEQNRSDRITQIRDDAQAKVDELSGGAKVNENELRDKYRKQLEVLQATIDSTSTQPVQKAAAQAGLELINALIPEEVAKARIDSVEKQTTAVISTQQSEIDRTSALINAHAITEQQGRSAILKAIIAQRDAVSSAIPVLQQEADLLPGNAEQQEKVDAYRTKLLELNISVQQMSDQFFQLKEAGIAATQTAFEDFIKSIPNLLSSNGPALSNISALQEHLGSARLQLQQLLNTPNKTSDTQQQISAVRTEIQQTEVELKNAQSGITTWASLFAAAARSIVGSLFDVATHMLAVLAIQRALKAIGFGALSGGGDVAGTVEAGGTLGLAGGGYIAGPGSATSDSIPAWLSNGEFVVRASAVQTVGRDFLEAVNMSGGARGTTPRFRGGFADGGLVTASGGAQSSGFNATVGLESGLVVKHMKSREGTNVQLSTLAANKNKVRQILGIG